MFNKHSDSDFPPVSFYFSVDVGGFSGIDANFQEVSGLEATRDVEEIVEGGMNQYKHKVPTRTTYGNLTLKRGLVVSGSALADWCEATLFSNLETAIEPKDITIELLSVEDDSAVMTWNITRAFPVKWSVSNFNSQDNAIATETLEFAFHGFERV